MKIANIFLLSGLSVISTSAAAFDSWDDYHQEYWFVNETGGIGVSISGILNSASGYKKDPHLHKQPITVNGGDKKTFRIKWEAVAGDTVSSTYTMPVVQKDVSGEPKICDIVWTGEHYNYLNYPPTITQYSDTVICNATSNGEIHVYYQKSGS